MVGGDPQSLHSGTLAPLIDTNTAPFGPLKHNELLDQESAPLTTDQPTFTTTSEDPSNQAYSTSTIVNSLITFYNKMTGYEMKMNTSCQMNCSGRGECINGTCFCSVQYEGETCRDPNIAYFASFSSIFFIIAAISLAQLLVCIRAEYRRLKTPTIRAACSVTTQKMLYFITFVAAAIRGAYFASPSNSELTLASSFLSSFYPIILSGGSLIVCFWAEAFHLSDIRCEKPRFLGKSFLGFLAFNFITYSLFLAELILQRYSGSTEERHLLTHVFNGCYAVLMFVMVVFFLIYGVEVYFKVRGGFLSDRIVVSRVQNRVKRRSLLIAGPSTEESDSANHRDDFEKGSDSEDSDSEMLECEVGEDEEEGLCGAERDHLANPVDNFTSKESLLPNENGKSEKENPKGMRSKGKEKHKKMKGKTYNTVDRGIDYSQLSQSRFGLVFQACMLMITVLFLFSDVLGGFWKNRVPLISRNAYDIVFRVVELGVALWFPCVLWNCIAPEQLWILNPRKILKIDIDKSVEAAAPRETETKSPAAELAESSRECWICYETEEGAPTAGSMIEPCLCRGDVAAVHHNCLRTWLMECAQNNNTGNLACKVCQADYQLERSPNWSIGQGFTTRHWLRTAFLVTVMCGTIAGSWAVLQMFSDGLIRSITAGSMTLVLYLCLRFLGFNTFTAYQRARYSAVKILGRHFTAPQATASPLPHDNGACSDSIATAGPSTSEVLPTVATISGRQTTLNISSPSI